MRTTLLVLCLISTFASTAHAQRPMYLASTSAELQALQCSNSDEQPGCKMYYAGFAHTIDMRFTEHLCGNVDDLLYEFEHEVRTNPAVRKWRGGTVLLSLLAKNHDCTKIKGRIQNRMSAGNLIDMCHTGEVGFNLCTYYTAGFIDALAFESKVAERTLLCGDQRIIDRANVARLLNDKLNADFRLRRDSAVAVMFNELAAHMPCSKTNISAKPPEDVAQLIAQEETLNDKCLGGSGDDKATLKACAERDVVLEKIKAKNWCWGHDGQVGADRTWEPCQGKK